MCTSFTCPTRRSPLTPRWRPGAPARAGQNPPRGAIQRAREYIERARRIVPIVSVQNRYSFADREWDFVVDYCEQHGIGFMPWAPMGQMRFAHEALERAAKQLNATPMQVGLAWLLKRAKNILPIPGTANVEHLEQNVAAAALRLPDEIFAELSAVNPPPAVLRG